MPRLTSLSYYCLYLTILLLPWYVVRTSVAGIPLTLLELSIVATIIAWGVGLIADHRRPFLPNKYWLLWTGLFILAATLALGWSGDHRQALGAYKAYIIEPVLVGLIVFDLLHLHPERLKWILRSVFVVGWQIALLCFCQFVFHWPVFAPAEAAQGRSSAVFNTANAVGLLIGPMAAICLPWLWHKQLLAQKMWWLVVASFGAISLAILLSKSRGGLLALATIFGLSLVFRFFDPATVSKQLWRIVTILVILGYVLITITWMWWFNHPPKVANPYTRPGFTTLTVRACTWEGTVKGLSLSPLKGFGLANFTNVYLKHYTCDAEPLVYPHNFVLNFWTETGLLGLFAIMGLTVYWLWSAYPDKQLPIKARNIRLGLVLVLIYWLVHGMVDVPYFKNDLSVAWWLWIAILASVVAVEHHWKPST